VVFGAKWYANFGNTIVFHFELFGILGNPGVFFSSARFSLSKENEERNERMKKYPWVSEDGCLVGLVASPT